MKQGRDERVLGQLIEWDFRSDKERVLTTSSPENEQIDTVAGPVPYLAWCEAEAARISRAKVRAVRVVRRDGRCWLVGNYFEPRHYQAKA